MFMIKLAVLLTLVNLVTGTDYLIAVHQKSYKKYRFLQAEADETGGMVKIVYPNHNEQEVQYLLSNRIVTINIAKHIGSGTSLGFDYNTILVSCSNDATKLTVHSDNFKYNVFTPLPVSALGTKYIVSSPSCFQYRYPFYDSKLLVIAAYDQRTNVDIKPAGNGYISFDGRVYRKGDTFTLSLKAFQTFTLTTHSDLSGTIVNSSNTIAVYSGISNSSFVKDYQQLLPVKHFAKEYAVVVDNSESPFHLQIISEQDGMKITFNNGSTASVNGSVITRQLIQNETFHFLSNYPVMATLCRWTRSQSGFAVIPPVSRYPQVNRISLKQNSKTMFLTSKTVKANITNRYITTDWYEIQNSDFKVGTVSSSRSYYTAYTFPTGVVGAVFTYREDLFYIIGMSFREDGLSIVDPETTYVAVFPKLWNQAPFLTAVGDTDATYQVWYPRKGQLRNRNISSYESDRFYVAYDMIIESGIENKTVILKTNSESLRLSCESRYYMTSDYLSYSNLGREYIVPFTDAHNVSKVQLIVATGKKGAVVEVRVAQDLSYENVTYKTGESIRFTLHEYQTLTINNNNTFSGTVVSATQKIAVFTLYTFDYVYGYRKPFFSQLPPVGKYGKEFAAAVGDPPFFSKYYDEFEAEYYVVITCAYDDTRISFNDGNQVVVGAGQFYRESLRLNGSINFSATKPVISLLCADISYRGSIRDSSCTILSPVELYDKLAVFTLLHETNDIRIMTGRDNRDLQIEYSNGRAWKEKINLNWTNIQKTHFKVGTALSGAGTFDIKSKQAFSVVVFGGRAYDGAFFIHEFQSVSSLSVKSCKTTTWPCPDDSTILPISNMSAESTNSGYTRRFLLVVGGMCGGVISILGCFIGALIVHTRCRSKGRAAKKNSVQYEPEDAPTSSNIATILGSNTYENTIVSEGENPYDDMATDVS